MFGDQANGNNGAQQEGGATRAPSLSLPRGGGATRGMGAKFGAISVTGKGSMTVPIVTSPDRSGFGPQLAVSYGSGNGSLQARLESFAIKSRRSTDDQRKNTT